MKRKGFFAALLTVTIIPFFSFLSIGKTSERKAKGFKINAGEGRIHGHLKLNGVNSNILDVKISGKDTDGDLAIFEQTSLSQGRGTPLHIHNSQDEIFYVIAGAYYFQVGDQKYNLGIGDSIFLPRKVPHAWTQISEKGKMTVILQPAEKLEDFFITMAGLDHEPDANEIKKVFLDNEMQVVGPALKVE